MIVLSAIVIHCNVKPGATLVIDNQFLIDLERSNDRQSQSTG